MRSAGLAVALAITLAGCGGVSSPEVASVPVPPPEVAFSLDGTSWEAMAVGGEGTGGRGHYVISFEGNGLRANLGCNELRGTYVVRADQLILTGSMNTERGCYDPRPGAPDPMRFEERGFRILSRPMKMEMVGNLLSLSNRAGSLTLRRLP